MSLLEYDLLYISECSEEAHSVLSSVCLILSIVNQDLSCWFLLYRTKISFTLLSFYLQSTLKNCFFTHSVLMLIASRMKEE